MGAPADRLDDFEAQFKKLRREIETLDRGMFRRGRLGKQTADLAEATEPIATSAKTTAEGAQGELDANRAAAWHNIGAAGEPGFENGWGNAGGDAAPVGYYEDTFGRVMLRGVARPPAGVVLPSTVFTLGEGFRPVAIHVFVGGTAAAMSVVYVHPDGRVQVTEGAAAEGVDVPLDSISFRTL